MIHGNAKLAEKEEVCTIVKENLFFCDIFVIKVSGYLTSHLLLSLPSPKAEKEFEEKLLFICKHDAQGAMGFILNQTLVGISLTDLIQQTEGGIESGGDTLLRDPPIFWGGPAEIDRGFVLHSMDYKSDQTISVDEQYGITANLDILKNIIHGKEPPNDYAVFLGYSAWKAGQLEKEVARHAWLPIPATHALIFQVSPEEKWEKAFHQLESSSMYFSPTQGRA
jgi:putative transcriptional regulator